MDKMDKNIRPKKGNCQLFQEEIKELNEIMDKTESGGNTGIRRTYWCFTLNNYEIENWIELYTILQKDCEWIVAQEEIAPTTGMKHIQGTLKFKSQKRLTELKKYDRTLHWEPTRQIRDAVKYCSEKKKRYGNVYSYGIEIKDKYASLKQKIYDKDNIHWKDWQLNCLNILEKEPDRRTIHWYWDSKGNVGKSFLAKYIYLNYCDKGVIICEGKTNDIMNQIIMLEKNKHISPSIILIDIPRSSLDFINYTAIEKLKNGLIYSGKYEGGVCVFDNPHVIVFANEPPARGQLSHDRLCIYEIDY